MRACVCVEVCGSMCEYVSAREGRGGEDGRVEEWKGASEIKTVVSAVHVPAIALVYLCHSANCVFGSSGCTSMMNSP